MARRCTQSPGGASTANDSYLCGGSVFSTYHAPVRKPGCRANALRRPVLRMGELEIENSEARQLLVSLLAQVTPGQWMHFGAFARFVYRLNPLFLQRRQRYFASPHWWLEDNPDKPLKPSQFKDWQ